MEWTVLSRILEGCTIKLEQACYLLASGNEIDHSGGSRNRLNLDRNLVCVRVSRTVFRARYRVRASNARIHQMRRIVPTHVK